MKNNNLKHTCESNTNGKSAESSKHFKRSMLAICVLAASYPAMAAAATDSSDLAEEVLITGFKEALDSAQEIKRKSDTVVDSITSKDLGSFPDKSVAEALQRVPGVTVTRFADPKRTFFFTGEPAGVVIRGLPQVRSEFNGRDTFSATSSRGLTWSDVPPELMGGVDIYKNQTAELVEGGISGTINLRTRLPFDSSGQVVAFSGGYNYNSTTGEKSPQVSGLFSDRWDTSVGEFGVMANIATSKQDGSTYSSGRYSYTRYQDIYPDSSGKTQGAKFLPTGVYMSEFNFDRERVGGALALQWQDSEGKYLASLQFNRSNYKNSSDGRDIATSVGNFPSWPPSLKVGFTPDRIGEVAMPAPGTPNFEFGPNGEFLRGTPVVPHGFYGSTVAESINWGGKLSDGRPIVPNEGCGWGGCPDNLKYIGNQVTADGHFQDTNENVQDLSFNFKWNPTDTIHANFDLQYIDASMDNMYKGSGVSLFANTTLDVSGDQMKLQLSEPTNINTIKKSGGSIFTDPNNYSPQAINSRMEDNFGHEFASRADVVFDVDNGYIQKVKTGLRYSDRFQNVKSAQEWGNTAYYWSQPGDWKNLDTPAKTITKDGKTYNFKGYPIEQFTARSWKNKWGQFTTNDGFDQMIFPDSKAMRTWENTFTQESLGLPENTGYNALCSGLGSRAGIIPGLCYKPDEVLEVDEKTEAAYIQVNFGGDDLNVFDRPLSGNIGVRYVTTNLMSSGAESFPLLQGDNRDCKDATVTDPNNPPEIPKTLGCYISADDKAFTTGNANLGSADVTHHNLLPSLNIKYEITDELQSRLAFSRGLSRPDIGLTRNYINVQAILPANKLTDPAWVLGSDGLPKGAKVYYKANAQNPYLKPIQADSMDWTLEYYFSKAGNLTFAAFNKKFYDYIQGANYSRKMTINGVTRDVLVSGPVNGDGASVKGFEIQGTRFFDFFPAPFDGFGVQANYTYIENHGIKNTGVRGSENNGQAGGLAVDKISVDALEGMSKNSYSTTLMYEKGSWSARLAYSWRSAFLVTTADADLSYPIWSEAYGQTDASVYYKLNDKYEIGLSLSNLLNEKFRTTQQVKGDDEGGLRLPTSTGRSEQRYDLTFRANF